MITDDELADLPEDPELAFIAFEQILRKKTEETIFTAGERADTTDIRLEYINKVLAAARAYEIDALKEWEVPRAHDDDIFIAYRSFTADVDHYTTQIRILNVSRTKKYSVELTSQSKRKIHHFISQIKDTIEAAQLELDKKNALLDKINAFSLEVDRNRTRLQAAAAIYLSLTSTIGDGIKNLEPAKGFFDSIAQLMGKEKETEDTLARLPSPTERKRLAPPRKSLPAPSEQSSDDDKIPF